MQRDQRRQAGHYECTFRGTSINTSTSISTTDFSTHLGRAQGQVSARVQRETRLRQGPRRDARARSVRSTGETAPAPDRHPSARRCQSRARRASSRRHTRARHGHQRADAVDLQPGCGAEGRQTSRHQAARRPATQLDSTAPKQHARAGGRAATRPSDVRLESAQQGAEACALPDEDDRRHY